MDTLAAFAMGEAHRDERMRVFDWNRAAQLIAERCPQVASAGLQGDWEWTGDHIYRDGAPVPADEAYTYLASTWAVPELGMDGEVGDCWMWEDESPGWDASTYWPQSALTVLKGSNDE